MAEPFGGTPAVCQCHSTASPHRQVLILRNVGAALSDSATDGLAIDADVESVSGSISAWQGAGRMLGLIFATQVRAAEACAQ